MSLQRHLLSAAPWVGVAKSLIGAPHMMPVSIKWDKSLKLEKSLSRAWSTDLCVYTLTIDGIEAGGIEVKSWMLYAQWGWFRRLIDSKFEETITRHVVMPSWMTPKMLLTVLSVMCGTSDEHEVSLLEAIDAYLLFSMSDELELGENACFGRLLSKLAWIMDGWLHKESILDVLTALWKYGIDLKTDAIALKARCLAKVHQSELTLGDLRNVPLDVVTFLLEM